MIKKVIKYIFALIIGMIFMNNVYAANYNCQYHIQSAGRYFTVNVKYNENSKAPGSYYYCTSTSQLTSQCNSNKRELSETLSDFHAMNNDSVFEGNWYVGFLYGGYAYNIYDYFKGGNCPKLQFNWSSLDTWNEDPFIYFDVSGATITGDGTQITVPADPDVSNGKKDKIKCVTRVSAYGAAYPQAIDIGNVNFCKRDDGTNYVQFTKYNNKEYDVDMSKNFSKKIGGKTFVISKSEYSKMFDASYESARNIFAWPQKAEGTYQVTFIDNFENYKSKYIGANVLVDDDDFDIGGAYKSIKDNLCHTDKDVLRVLKFVGYILLIVKILIPLGLIAVGAMQLTNVVVSGDADEMRKVVKSLGTKIIIAIGVFVLPTIINYVVGLIDGATDGIDDYENCRECIMSPGDCKY